MCGTSSAGFPQYLGKYGEGHDSLVVIIFPVGSFWSTILGANLSFLEGAFVVSSFSKYQSTRV